MSFEPSRELSPKIVPAYPDNSPGAIEQPDFVVEPLPESSADTDWLKNRIEIVRRYYLLIIAAAALVAAVTVYKSKQAIPMYRASATVRFNDTRSNLTSGVGTNVQRPISWSIDPIKSQLELFASRATAETAVDQAQLQLGEVTYKGSLEWLSDINAADVRVADTLRLTFNDNGVSAEFAKLTATAPYGEPVKLAGLEFIVKSRPSASSANFTVMPRERVIAMLQGGLRATRRTDTDIADLSFISLNPDFAQRALNAAARALQSLSMRASEQTARARRQFLDQQLRKTDSVLEAERGQLSAFRTSTQTFSSRERISSEQAGLSGIRVRREELRSDRDVFASLLARASAAQQSGNADALRAVLSTPTVSGNPALVALAQQFSQLKLAKDSLTAGPYPAAPTNPDVIRLNGLISAAGEQVIAAIKSQLESFDVRIRALDGLENRSTDQASILPAREAEEAKLVQQTEATQRIAEQLREEQQRASISEVAQGADVQIIDLARQPGRAANAAQKPKLVLFTFLTILLSIELALLLDSLNKTFRKPEEAEKALSLPTLGTIPRLCGERSVARKLLPGLGKVTAKVSSSKALASTHQSTLIVDNGSTAFESFRALRTSLMFSNAVRSIRSIVITSAAPGDGKSTTAANLAAAFAQQGMRVLAIDCDTRRGRLHKLFARPLSPGLMDVVIGEVPLADAIRETTIPNLFVLSAGKNPPNSTELLGSDLVRRILQQLSSEFDMLIIDTPPVLATADPAVIGSYVDGVVIVLRVGTTDRAAAKRAVDRMRATGARVLGMVLNDPDEMLGVRDHYYEYQYGEEGATAR